MEPSSSSSAAESQGKPLWNHLDELRRALMRMVLVVFVGWCGTFYFSDAIVKYLQQPLLRVLPDAQKTLYYTGITDKFMVYMQISVLASIAITFPYLLSQVWRLLAPFLDKSQKRFAGPFIIFGTLSFLVGISFAYFVIIPMGYEYLIHFGNKEDVPLITLTEYFSLTIKIMMIAGIVFELPVIMVLLGRFGLVTHQFLVRYRKHAILVIAVVSSIATPSPDAVTLAAVMIPMYLLYELSILGVRFTSSRS